MASSSANLTDVETITEIEILTFFWLILKVDP